MQCLHCAHPHYIFYGTSHGVQRYRYHACHRISDATTWQRSSPQATGLSTLSGRDEDASYRPDCQLITRRYLAGQIKLPKHSQQAHHRPKPAPSSKSMNSKLSSLKKISILALASRRLHLWQVPRLCLWKRDDQNRWGLETDQEPANDRLGHGIAEGLREFHSTRQGLRGKDLHKTN